MNLFEEAAARSADLEDRFDQIRSTLTRSEWGFVEKFVRWVSHHGSVGINMRQSVLLAFLTTNEYQNIYEWAEFVSSVSHQPSQDILRKRLGIYYERRTFFDDNFEGGQKFRYGTLITTGVGAILYGDYCTVLTDDARAHLELAYLMRDSLKTYFLPGNKLDTKSLTEQIAVESVKHILAAIKLYREIPVTHESRWGALLCSKDDYLEAVFNGSIAAEDVKEVRLSKSDYDLYFYLAFDGFREKLDTATRALIEGFAFIVKLANSKGIHLEVV